MISDLYTKFEQSKSKLSYRTAGARSGIVNSTIIVRLAKGGDEFIDKISKVVATSIIIIVYSSTNR